MAGVEKRAKSKAIGMLKDSGRSDERLLASLKSCSLGAVGIQVSGFVIARSVNP
jgi:hypothetical protein